MASRNFTQFRYSLEKQAVDIWARVAIGASGAPTLKMINPAGSVADAPAGGVRGVASIARNSAGVYTITLQDKYRALLGGSVSFLCGEGSGPTAPIWGFDGATSPTAGTVKINLYDTSGAKDPGDGETLLIHLMLSNSSV